MSIQSSLPEMTEVQQTRPVDAGLVAQPHKITPDPLVIEKIGNGLHDLYDSVPKSALPIYFGPVLGELYLTPLPRRKPA